MSSHLFYLVSNGEKKRRTGRSPAPKIPLMFEVVYDRTLCLRQIAAIAIHRQENKIDRLDRHSFEIGRNWHTPEKTELRRPRGLAGMRRAPLYPASGIRSTP